MYKQLVKPVSSTTAKSAKDSSRRPFIIRVNTALAGVTASNQFQLLLEAGRPYNFSLNWGDGTVEQITTSTSPTHTYASSGIYDISISEQFYKTYFAASAEGNKVLDVVQWGDIQLGGNQDQAWRGCGNCVFSASDTPDLSIVTSMSAYLRSCTSVPNLDFIRRANTSRVTDWSRFGQNTNALTTPSLIGINTSAATSFNRLFTSAANFDGDLSVLDWTNVSTATDLTTDTSFSTTNYDKLLIALDAYSTLQNGVTLEIGTTQYSAGAAATARASIISKWSWTIIDGGVAP